MATDNLKKVVLLVTKLVTDGETVFKDGFQFTDVFVFIPELSQIPEIIKNKVALSAEIKSLTPMDIKDLATYIETNLVLQDKNTEGIIEAVVEVLVALFNLIVKIKGTPKPVPPTPPVS